MTTIYKQRRITVLTGKMTGIFRVCMLAVLIAIFGAQALFSAVPAKGFIVYGSNRSGAWRIWKMDVDGSNKTQLSPNHDAVMPSISDDGRWIMYKRGTSAAATTLWVMRNDGSEAREVTTGSHASGLPCPPAWGTGGFYYQKNNRIYRYDPQANTSTSAYDLTQFSGLDISNIVSNIGGVTADGRWVLLHSRRYDKGYTGTNGYYVSGHSAIAVDNQNKSRVYFFGYGCEPTAAPAGTRIYHVANEKTTPDGGPGVWRMEISELATAMTSRTTYLPEVDWAEANHGHEYFPRISNDNTWLIYGGSTGCHPHYACNYEIFVHELGKSGDRTQLTNDSYYNNWPHLWVGDEPGAETDPDFSLSHSSLSFSGTTGASSPSGQTVTAISVGGHALTGLTAAESAAWLSTSVSGSADTMRITNTVSISSLSTGNYSTTVTVTAGSITKTYTVALTVSDAQSFHLKINAGGNTVAGWDSDDSYVAGGSDFLSTAAFSTSGVTDPGPEALYKSCRHLEPSFTFASLPEGNYRVRLHFADPIVSTDRAMSISIQDELMFYKYDIAAAAGGERKAIIEEVVLRISEGDSLTIALDKADGNDAFLCGIEVIATDSTPVPFFKLHAPSAGDTLDAASSTAIMWGGLNADDAVVNFSSDGGLSWSNVTSTAVTPDDTSWGALQWTVPDVSSTQCYLRISTYEGVGVVSSGMFVIQGGAFVATPVRSSHAAHFSVNHDIAASRLSIVLPIHKGKPVGAVLCNAIGMRVRSSDMTLRADKSVSTAVFSTENLGSGVYFIAGETAGERFVRKVVLHGLR